MLQIKDTIISLELFEHKFACDLNSCKGICCIEGDSGAPLEDDEISKIEEILPLIWSDLSETSRELIHKQGVYYIDIEGEPVASIVNGRECVFTYTDENGICKCAIEKAFREGKTTFYKPISCHLYPIRLQKYNDFTAVNLHHWNICKCALTNGNKLKIPVFEFLKDPLIRRFGSEWFEELKIASENIHHLTITPRLGKSENISEI